MNKQLKKYIMVKNANGSSVRKTDNQHVNKDNLETIPLVDAIPPIHTDFPLAKLSQEILERAKAEGLDSRSMTLLVSAMVISGFSVVVFYRPNMIAGQIFAKQSHLPKKLLQALFVSGSLSTNFIVNAFFSYDIPNTLIDSLRAVPWLWRQRSIMGDINHNEDLTGYQVFSLAIKECMLLILKSIPVIASTAQMVALGMESNLAEWLLVAQLAANVLMHWSSVTHFVDNAIKASWRKMRSYYPWQDPQITFQLLISDHQKKILSQYENTLENTLYKLRLLLESEQNNQKFVVDNDIENPLLTHSFKTQLDNIYQLSEENKAFELQLALLTLTNQQHLPHKKKPGNELFAFNVINFLLINLCYLGYDVMVYRQTEKYSPLQMGVNIFIAFLLTFPLNYLISCIIAPSNARKLWDLLAHVQQEKSVAHQRYPNTFKFLFGVLFTMAFFSFGTTILLNDQYLPNQYIKNPYSLVGVNIISMIYNTYFNAFPLPIIVPALILPLHQLINAILKPFVACFGYHLQNDTINETRKAIILENFLMGLARSTQFLTPQGFLKALLKQNENTLQLLMDSQTPKEVLNDTFFGGKSWRSTLTLLSDSQHLDQQSYFDAIQKTKMPKILDAQQPVKTSKSSWSAWYCQFNINNKVAQKADLNNSVLPIL